MHINLGKSAFNRKIIILNGFRAKQKTCRSSNALAMAFSIAAKQHFYNKSRIPTKCQRLLGLGLGLSRFCQSRPFASGHKSNDSQQTHQSLDSSTSAKSTGSNWYAIPISVGIVYIGLMQLYKISKRNDDDSQLFADLKTLPLYLRVYASLPLRYISQCWGYLNNLTVPVWARSPLYKTYSYLFGCNLLEMKEPSEGLAGFENLGQFFYRELKQGARPIAEKSLVVSPSDGKVLYCGQIEGNDEINKIKNASYTVSNLMGPPPVQEDISWASYLSLSSKTFSAPSSYEPKSRENALFYAVIYLAPGDYHRFHSPASWSIDEFRHFYGEMFSVSPWLVSKFPTLFTLNERVSCVGKWKYGMFGMTAVAATNVGKIIINDLPDLETNSPKDINLIVPHGVPKSLTKCSPALSLNKGQEIGGFKLGSTIVLVFEAPKTFAFKLGEGDSVRMGQALGNL